MPIIPTPTLRVRQLGDLVDAGDEVGDGLQTAAAGAQGAVNTVASAPGAAVGVSPGTCDTLPGSKLTSGRERQSNGRTCRPR